MPLDDKKIKAIQKCIEKGTLEVTINRVDLAAGEVGDPWLYD
jgi:anti-sigma28 factor (negative regulator of flagellin synthesis)